MMFPLPETSRSELLGKVVQYIGFTFTPHIKKREHFIQISIYRIRNRQTYILCVSEGPGRGDVKLALDGLGNFLPGDGIAPLAQRKLDLEGAAAKSFEDFRSVLESTYKGKWYWYEEGPISN